MQHFIGVGIGGLVTYGLLYLMVGSQYADKYLPAVVIGAIVALAWPWVIGLLLARRVKNRRDEKIQKEVDAQMKAKGG
jgi:uncharacterized membrane protein YciS (DUF1049 family)